MIVGRSIRKDQLPRIRSLLEEYLLTFAENLNSNNWTGGALEVSMMREFHRNAAVDSKILADTSPSYQLEREFVRTLIGANANAEVLGTVQDAAHSGRYRI
ncbi:hypothetical protein C8R44DRAFT_752157 [Mycena epipterygia]|nr:hypothetical protein C8R44DRAFT_752157 [Mycena epipterygia]